MIDYKQILKDAGVELPPVGPSLKWTAFSGEQKGRGVEREYSAAATILRDPRNVGSRDYDLKRWVDHHYSKVYVWNDTESQTMSNKSFKLMAIEDGLLESGDY